MRLRWERPGIVQMAVKVEELAALVAGARVAARALATQPGEKGAELERILAEFDRASPGLKGGLKTGLKGGVPGDPQLPAPAPGDGEGWYQPGSRSLQDRFGTRRLADRIAGKFLSDRLDDNDRAFVERADMFFLATADGRGRPSCSYKGGDPGFVTVVDERTLAFPNYDGNGMFVSLGNALANPEVGLLFIDFERGHRLRINGTVSIDGRDPLLAVYPGAQFMVRVAIRDAFPNCPRYIHRYRLVERSTYVPHAGQAAPVPDWKQEDWAADVLPTGSPASRDDHRKDMTMHELAALHSLACNEVSTRIDAIGDAQWGLPTPCTEWNVRDLVAHLVGGTSWVAPLIEGETIAEVGDRFDGDLLGEDPVGAWHRAAAAAVGACGGKGAMERLVHLSSGDSPASGYVGERILDLAMHAWDLARATGTDDRLDPDVVDAARKVLAEKADLWRRHGALGPAVETAPDADAQTLLLAESGRRV